MRVRIFFISFFLLLAYSVFVYAQDEGRKELRYGFAIDATGEGFRIQVYQILKKTGQSDCLIEFIYVHRGQEIKYHDKCSISPLTLDDMTLFKAEVVGTGQVETIDYMIGVGVSGIQSRKKLIFDPVNNKIFDIHYAEGGASGLEKAKKLEDGKYLLPLLEASYILPGFQGYGPSLYSGYLAEYSAKGVSITHILNPVSKPDSEAKKHIERLHNPEWCKFLYKEQMIEYQDALKMVRDLKETKGKIQRLVDKTERFCGLK